MSDKKPNLAALMDQVPMIIKGESYEWALEESKIWPHGMYSHYDFTCMYQKGYLAGYLAGISAPAAGKEGE